MGPPEFTENPVPTWEEFLSDYQDHFFDGSRPQTGRSFIIEHDGEVVGHTNYQIDEERAFAELDIWMRDSFCCSHGWGSQAIDLLCDLVHESFGINEFILRPSARNVRAIRSYARAGFVQLPLSNGEQAAIYGRGDYHDTIVMQRRFDLR